MTCLFCLQSIDGVVALHCASKIATAPNLVIKNSKILSIFLEGFSNKSNAGSSSYLFMLIVFRNFID